MSVYEGGPADDMCEIAETGARAAVAALADGEIGTRARVDGTTALGGTDACSLLQAADLAIIPGLRSPVPGTGDWTCTWDDGAPDSTELWLSFYLGSPHAESSYSLTDVAARPGAVQATEDGCRLMFAQRNYTDEEANPRTESVWLELSGPGRGADPCGTVRALAAIAASKLPPPT